MQINETALKRGRLMYVFEATLEYLISILVASSFLATLTKELGMSDSLTGILSSVISLGCLFQLLSIFYRRQKKKNFVIIMSVINQLMFMAMYVIPLAGGGKQYKIVIFVIAIFMAYLLYNFAHPKKIDWMMSLVDDSHRGRFTANKEIVSLITGMIFSYSMGAFIDYFAAKGQIKTAFILSAIVIFVLMVLHTTTMVLTIEKPVEVQKKRSLKRSITDVLSNKNVIRVSIVFILYNAAYYSATPFFGTYQINELGLSLKLTSALAILSSLVRIFVSRYWGTYADKNSFAKMIERCLLILTVGFVCAAMAVPSNGLVMFAGYYICNGIAQGGINSALINLIFDYVTPDKRADSLAICQAVAGVTGFIATLLMSPLITLVQSSGNQVFGMAMYAQQITSIIAIIFILLTILFIRKNFKRKGVENDGKRSN